MEKAAKEKDRRKNRHCHDSDSFSTEELFSIFLLLLTTSSKKVIVAELWRDSLPFKNNSFTFLCFRWVFAQVTLLRPALTRKCGSIKIVRNRLEKESWRASAVFARKTLTNGSNPPLLFLSFRTIWGKIRARGSFWKMNTVLTCLLFMWNFHPTASRTIFFLEVKARLEKEQKKRHITHVCCTIHAHSTKKRLFFSHFLSEGPNL